MLDIIGIGIWIILTIIVFLAYMKSHTMISSSPEAEMHGCLGMLISSGIIAGVIITVVYMFFSWLIGLIIEYWYIPVGIICLLVIFITKEKYPEKLKFIVLGAIIIMSIGFALDDDSNKNDGAKKVKTTYITPQSNNKNSSANNEKKAIVADSDLSLGGVALGYSIDQMHNILGRETSIEDNGMYKFYNYSDIQVGIKDGKVDSLVSNSSVVETKRGIHQGSNLQDVLNKYGDNYSKTDYNDLILYEYTFAADNGKNGILRFAINKSNNQVNYISVRIPDETTSSSSAANEAKQVLNNYYAAITRHDMRVAYNILSADMQTHMGSLDVYADGYKTTLSDEIFDVQVTSDSGDEIAFSYILTARDKYNNGVKEQTFACTALLSKKTGSWHIVDMSAKKQSERIVSR